MSIEKAFNRMIAPLKRKVNLMLSRGIVARVDDSSGIKRIQGTLLADEVLDNIEVFQEYGFSSRPPRGSEFVMASIGGNREHPICIATMNRDLRVKNLKEGETLIFDKDGNFIHLQDGGNIEIKTSTKVKVDAPDAEFTGNVLVKGNFVVNGTSNLDGAVTAGATLDITGATTATTILATGVTSSGPVAGAGITDTLSAVSIATLKTTFNTHTHTEQTGSGTAQTSPPTPLL